MPETAMVADLTGNVTARLVLGLGLVLLGSIFLLDELNLVDFDDVVRWWPLVPILLGLNLLVRPGGSAARGFGVVLVTVGVWQLLYELELVDTGIGDAWPIILIALGCWIVWRSLTGPEQVVAPHPATATAVVAAAPGAYAKAAGAHFGNAETLSAFAFLGHVQKGSSSPRFQGADVTAIMGGCTLDLRGADLDPEGAVIDAFAFWGGIEVLVPEGWVVDNKVLPLLAGAEDRTQPAAGASKHLLVRGTALMAGIEIANQPDDSGGE
jgi:hypothetical protein